MTSKRKFSNTPKLEVVRQRLQPRYGSRYRALLAGGPSDLALALTDKLEEHGVDVVDHRPVDKPNLMARPLPARIDLAIVLVDMCSHSHTLAVAKRCETATPPIPCIRTQRKMARMLTDLRTRGVDIDHPASKPVEKRPVAPEQPEPVEKIQPACELQVVSGHVNQQPVQEELPMTMTKQTEMPQPDPAPKPSLVDSYMSDGRRYLVDYAKRVRNNPWNANTDNVLVRLVEANPEAGGPEFLAELERLSGFYRTAGSISQRLRHMSSTFSVSIVALCRTLEQMAGDQTVAKRRYLKTEHTLISTGKPTGEMVSKVEAVKMVGGVVSRLNQLHSYFDPTTGIIFYRHAKVVELVNQLMLENGGRMPGKHERRSGALVKLPEVCQRILERLKDGPATVSGIAHVTPKRAQMAMGLLLKDGKVKLLPRTMQGSALYALPNWVDAPKAKRPEAPRPPKPAVPAAVEPAADIQSVEVKLRCPYCKTGNREGARFCCGCGANLQQPKCGACGVPLQPRAAFCDYCGTKSHVR